MRVVRGSELAGEQGHLRLRLLDADSGSESGNLLAKQGFPVAQPIVVGVNQWLKSERKPKVRRFHIISAEINSAQLFVLR